MQKWTNASISHLCGWMSLWLLAAAICLCPAVAGAGTLAPTDTATGTNALGHENGGSENTADGYYVLYNNTTGHGNTASGVDALYQNTAGYGNTASGTGALSANTTGYYNTASGAGALSDSTTGNNNTASGADALHVNTTGDTNVALGYQALYANTGGSYNVAVGANALAALTGSTNASSNNIALGNNAGKLTTSGGSNIYIGHPGVSGSESKVMRIGKAQAKTFIAGIAGVPLSGATVVVKSNGQLGVVASSARYKQDIRSLDDASGKLAQLRPVSFRYKAEPQAKHYGLIAEEVDKVMPELVVRDDQNRPDSVQYMEIIPLLLQERQEQRAELARQRELIERQAAELAALRSALETRLAALEGSNSESRLTLK